MFSPAPELAWFACTLFNSRARALVGTDRRSSKRQTDESERTCYRLLCDTLIKLKIYVTIFKIANKKSPCRKFFAKCWNLQGGRRLFKNRVISYILYTNCYVWKNCHSNQISPPLSTPHLWICHIQIDVAFEKARFLLIRCETILV